MLADLGGFFVCAKEIEMTVRAKMTVGGSVAKGRIGKYVTLNAVYEGSTELQELSENAVFGNATPNGYVSIAGDFDMPFLFSDPKEGYDPRASDEFYVDLDNRGEARKEDALAQFDVVKAYESAPNPKYPDYGTEFRFVGVDSLPAQVQFGMTVRNPAAIAMLQGMGVCTLTIRSALKRQSEKVIAIHKANYDAHVQRLKQDHPDWDDAKMLEYTRWARDKWLRAQGIRPMGD